MLGPLLDPPKVSGVGITRGSSKQAIARSGLEPQREVEVEIRIWTSLE